MFHSIQFRSKAKIIILTSYKISVQIVNEPLTKRLKTLKLFSTSGLKNGTDYCSALAYTECLEKCKSGNDALRLLVCISGAITYIAPEDVPIAIKKLAERRKSQLEPRFSMCLLNWEK